jgi:hypothetical protein
MGQEHGKSDILKIVYCEFYVSDTGYLNKFCYWLKE